MREGPLRNVRFRGGISESERIGVKGGVAWKMSEDSKVEWDIKGERDGKREL